MANLDPLYLGLLGTAESFRTSNPPNIKLCIQCLQGVLNCNPPPRLEARTHLQLGSVLLNFTENIDSARQHLEKAWTVSFQDPSLDDVKFESVSILSELLLKQGDSANACSLLHKGVELSQQSHYWQCRLLFQLSQLYITSRDLQMAYQLLDTGCNFSHSINSTHTELLFLLSKGLVALLMHNSQETSQVMSACGRMITEYHGSAESKGMLKAFFLTLQVTHYLSCGMTKSVKTLLRQLQDCIQHLTTQEDTAVAFNPTAQTIEVFQWMPKEHLCILVYLVSVYHAVQAGHLEKAQTYSEKALAQIQALKSIDESPLLTSFQVMLLENIIMCHISTGNKVTAIKQISHLKFICLQDSRLYQSHKSQLHTLIGLYAMAMNCMDNAISQFQTALGCCSDQHFWTFINLNLGIIYARSNRHSDFMALLQHIHPHQVPQESYSLKAAASYVNALQRFFQAQYPEAKLFLQDALKLANTEDLHKLTACGLVLLGQIFLQLGKTHEVLEMVNPAMQLAQKIPEVNIQLWGTAMLKDLYRVCGNFTGEAQESHAHSTLSHTLLTDHCNASESPEHNVISWVGDMSQSMDYHHLNGGGTSAMASTSHATNGNPSHHTASHGTPSHPTHAASSHPNAHSAHQLDQYL